MRNDPDTEHQLAATAALSSTRREKPRARLDRIVYLNLRSGNGGIVLDISEKGLALQTADRMSASGPVHFRFLVPSLERLEVAAEVIWLDETKKRGGLRFTDLPANVAEEIREWVRHSSEARNVEQPERVEQRRNDPPQSLSHDPENSSHPSPQLTDMPKQPVEFGDADPLKAPSELRKWLEGARKQNPNARPLGPLSDAPPSDAPMEPPAVLPVVPPDELNIPLDPQVRAAEAEALKRARRRAEYSGLYTSKPAPSQGKVEVTQQDAPEADASPSVHSASVQSPPAAPESSTTARALSVPLGADLRVAAEVAAPEATSAPAAQADPGYRQDSRQREHAVRPAESVKVEPKSSRKPQSEERPNRFAATHIGASTFGTLSAGAIGASERARRGDFPDHVRGLYAQHLEDDDPPWHWSATVLLAVVLGAAAMLLAFNYKVPIGHAVIQVGRKISGMAESGPAVPGNAAGYSPASGPPPPESASTRPDATSRTSGEPPVESSNTRRDEAAGAASSSPSFEISSRDAGVAPNSTDHPRIAESKNRREASEGTSEAWKYAQQHPRSVAPPAASDRRAFGATPGALSGDTAGGSPTGHDGDGAPELRLAQQYLEEGKYAAAADVLWLSLEKGNVEAEIELADLYGRGQGVPKSCAQAHVLVTAATEKSYALAEEETARLNAQGCK